MTRIVTTTEGQSEVLSTLLKYAANGRAVTYVVGERWEWDGVAGSCPTSYTFDYAKEFWYDSARLRYAVRDLNTASLTFPEYSVLSTFFSEYDGDSVYSTFTMDHGDATILTAYMPGIGEVSDPLGGGQMPHYHHADKLGTTRGWTTGPSDFTDTAVYTAFGELITGSNFRYGYVGKEGYQADDDVPLLHVGARYYDPGIGRFVQRDPIGIAGGLGVYTYVRNDPLRSIDPDGLRYIQDDWSPLPGVPVDEVEQRSTHLGCAVAMGIYAGLVAPGITGTLGIGWGLYRTSGGTTGHPDADATLDAACAGSMLSSWPQYIKKGALEFWGALKVIGQKLL